MLHGILLIFYACVLCFSNFFSASEIIKKYVIQCHTVFPVPKPKDSIWLPIKLQFHHLSANISTATQRYRGRISPFIKDKGATIIW